MNARARLTRTSCDFCEGEMQSLLIFISAVFTSAHSNSQAFSANHSQSIETSLVSGTVGRELHRNLVPDTVSVIVWTVIVEALLVLGVSAFMGLKFLKYYRWYKRHKDDIRERSTQSDGPRFTVVDASQERNILQTLASTLRHPHSFKLYITRRPSRAATAVPMQDTESSSFGKAAPAETMSLASDSSYSPASPTSLCTSSKMSLCSSYSTKSFLQADTSFETCSEISALGQRSPVETMSLHTVTSLDKTGRIYSADDERSRESHHQASKPSASN